MLIEIPLDSGSNDSTDSKLLPDGVLKVVENLALRRDGQLEVRAGDTALSMTDRDGETVNAYEVVSMNGRLLALGDGSSSGYPTDVYQFSPSGGVARWFGTRGPNQSGIARLPPAVGMRDLVTAPDQAGAVISCQAATFNGITVMAWSVGTSAVYARAFSADGTTLAERFSTSLITGETETIPRVVVTSGGTFWVLYPSDTGDIAGLRFTPATDSAFTFVSLVTNASAINNGHHAWSACGVENDTGGNDRFFISWSIGSTITLSLRNGATGAQTASYTGPAINATQMAMYAERGVIDRVFLVYRNSADTTWYIYQALVSTTVGSVGPTQLFLGDTTNLTRAWPGVTLDRRDTTRVIVVAPTGSGFTTYCTQVAGISIPAHGLDYRLPVNGVIHVGSQIVSVGSDAIAYVLPVSQAQNWLLLFDRNTSVSPASPSDVVPLAAVEQTVGFYPTSAGCVARDGSTGRIVWARPIAGNDGERRPQVAELSMPGTPATVPRRSAVLAGQLHVAGAMPVVFDGAQVVEQGLLHRPVISFDVQGTGGGLTILAQYSWVVTWEWADATGRLIRSQPSAPFTDTLTGANNASTLTVSTSIGLRNNVSRRLQGQDAVRVVLWRTVPNSGNFHRVATVSAPAANRIGQSLDILDTMSDANAASQEVLYTQSQTTLAHVAAEPHDCVWAAGDALLAGRLPSGPEWVRSKRLFPAEPVEWAERGRFQFRGCTAEDIESVGVIGENNVIFGSRTIDLVQGQGPDLTSGIGEFFPPVRISNDGGGEALLRTSFGLFFVSDGRIFLLPGGGGDAEWVGFPVQDILDAFPVVRDAVYVAAQEHVVFACNATDYGSGVLLRFDLRRKVWYTHTVATAIRSLAEFSGRLVYANSSGVVFLADAAPGTGQLVTARIRTGSSVDFASLGYGAISRIGILAEWRGPCTLGLAISYDDTKTFQNLASIALTSGLAVGDSVSRLWAPPRQRTDRFVLQFTMSHSIASPMLRLNKLLLEAEKAPGPTRLGASSNR